MIEALTRLCRDKMWADGRSARALVRRGLVKNHGRAVDPVIGEYSILEPTEQGRATLAAIIAEIQKGP